MLRNSLKNTLHENINKLVFFEKWQLLHCSNTIYAYFLKSGEVKIVQTKNSNFNES